MTSAIPTTAAGRARERLLVRGQVQGVGFRPFVYRLAHSLNISGWVCNQSGGVSIEIQGPPAQLQQFRHALQERPPVLARIRSVKIQPRPLVLEEDFHILASVDDGRQEVMLPDMAPCENCLTEMFDPSNRRYHYPFINCVDCGPRYSITRRLPYDRAQTSMASFQQCTSCQAEYDDPMNRRFHAQPNACANCGPRLWLATPDNPLGQRYNGLDPMLLDEPIRHICNALAKGKIAAIRGVGGFHLVCDARQSATVERLRRHKQRPTKPLALMIADLSAARPLVKPDEAATQQLLSPQRPIVLLERAENSPDWLEEIAPGLNEIGLMLPSSPLYALLLATAKLQDGRDPVWVVTSANRRGEPLLTDNHEALTQLADLANIFLLHDRDILAPCDDSLVRVHAQKLSLLRCARGYAPASINLPIAAAPVLAVGADLKNTICITHDSQAHVSVHVGDLTSRAARLSFDATVEHLLQSLEITPTLIVRDLHPDFYSSRAAEALAQRFGCPCIPVQHHYAHLAGVVAEHALTGPVLGLALDGMGLGTDGSLWGGELMRLEGVQWQRLGHLATLPLPSGDQSARDPWRMACAVLQRLNRSDEITTRFSTQPQAPLLQKLLGSDHFLASTSSAGRWFDAAAGLLGVIASSQYEGEAAMRLEALAYCCPSTVVPLNKGYIITPEGSLDLLPLLAKLADTTDAAFGAALFHATLIDALAAWTLAAAAQHQISMVTLSGGCFQNRLLRQGLRGRLQAEGLQVYEAQQVPCGDGGLSLGQAWHGVQMQAL